MTLEIFDESNFWFKGDSVKDVLSEVEDVVGILPFDDLPHVNEAKDGGGTSCEVVL